MISHISLANLCRRAYGSNDADIDHRITSKDDRDLSCDVFHYGKDVVIVFRGTDNPRDFITSININYGDNGTTHYGILRQINKVVLPQLRALGTLRNIELKNVYVTGHSLGGALAAVLAEELFLPSENLVTFGSMRVFNSDLKRERGIHYINNCDLIPTLPPNFKPFKNIVWLDRNGKKHAGLSKWRLFFARLKSFFLAAIKLKKFDAFRDHEMDEYVTKLAVLQQQVFQATINYKNGN